jgi:hypothetical protein
MANRILQLLQAALTTCVLCMPGLRAQAEDDHAFFESRIRPILVKRCYSCHSQTAKNLRAHLYLDSRDGWMRGGDSGSPIVPGKPDESLLIKAIRYDDPDLRMPPKGKLPDAERAALEQWIARGAPDPRTAGPATEQPEKAIAPLWSFAPMTTPAPPAVKRTDWSSNPVDHFILARLEAEDLAPAPPAERVILVRRLYFDLIGLPPTREQLKQALDNPSPNWKTELVDALLASSHFGERWGRHWLDIARYAESSGGGRSLVFPHAWRYRDYVIEALNSDKPYDRFVREQLAGDLLPAESPKQRAEQLTATGYLLLAPTNFELQDKSRLDFEIAEEQIDTLGRTFMGMTIGCAKCHDHKFDPVPAEDFYALAGIFLSTRSVKHSNVSRYWVNDLPLDPAEEAELLAYEANVKALEAELKNLDGLVKNKDQLVVTYDDRPGIILDNTEAETIGLWTSSVHQSGFFGEDYIFANNETDQAVKEAIFRFDLPEAGLYEVMIGYTQGPNRGTAVPVYVNDQRFLIDQQVHPDINGQFIHLGALELSQQTTIRITTEGTKGAIIADAVRLVRVDQQSTNTVVQASTDQAAQLSAIRTRQSDLKKKITGLKKSPPFVRTEVMAVAEMEKPSDTALRIRGDVHKPGEIIPRGFLQAISPGETAIPAHASGRLELAHWLSDPEHPLTSRVMVNRIWHHLFGVGLVRTPDNFGAMGETPSHPALLDYLAREFMADDWSVKTMIRRLVLSETYAQSVIDQVSDIDPENRLLWRMNRKRLEAEALRDAMLVSSGSMDWTAGGPSFKPGLGSVFGYDFKAERRSVYMPLFRNNLMDVMEVFDLANPNAPAGRRAISTLPTQALYLMNSPFVIKQAAAAAKNLSGNQPLDEKLTALYASTLSRAPTPRERELSHSFLMRNGPEPTLADWTQVQHTLYATLDFRYLY